MSDPIVVIPARLAATRLPDKPLADLLGEPMIVHVWRRAVAAGIGPVAVATDAPGIAEAVTRAGGTAVLTRADHPSGSDRIFEAVERLDPEGRHDAVVNVQGDLPTIDPRAIAAAILPLADPAVDIATLAALIQREEEKTDAERRQSRRQRGRAEPPSRPLLHARHRALGRRPALSPYRPLRLSPARPGALRRPAALPARAARAARAAARPRSRHAHRRHHRRRRAARRRHAA